MLYAYSFALLLVLFLLSNMLVRLTRSKKFQFIYNIILLLLLIANTYALSRTTETYLNFASINPFSAFFMLIFTIGIFLVTILAHSYSQDYSNFALLSSFALVGAYFVAFANSLITVFLGLECLSIPTTFIILLSRRQSLEAATKFFIMASVAIAILSFAIVLVYGGSGTLALGQQKQSTLLMFAAMLFIASLGFEASIFPFNALIPDVYHGSSAYATAMVDDVNKEVGFAALIQVLILLFISFKFAFQIIAILSVLTMFYGNLVALVQENFKRMLAYASISQAGYILIGIATQSAYGIEASIFQIFANMFLFIGIFSIISWLEKDERNVIEDLIGLYKENKFCAIALSIFVFSIIGVPFTTGFIGKFLIFLSATESELVWLAIIGIINSVISVFYFAKVMTAIYTNKLGARSIGINHETLVVVSICLILTLIFGIYPQPVMNMVKGGANYLFGLSP